LHGTWSSTSSSTTTTHTHADVRRWLEGHPRFTLHFTPTSSSWLNLVERWFRELSEKRIRRGAFPSVAALIEAIHEFLRTYNENPRPFTWTASVKTILDKVNKCKALLETLH
jgi:transposase